MDSQRNRPPELRTPDRILSEAEQALRASFEQFVAAGLPPAQVAERVLEAIREDRFYVFPHPELLGGVRQRMENVLAQRNPALALPGVLGAPGEP